MNKYKKDFRNTKIVCNTKEDFIDCGKYLEKIGYTWIDGKTTDELLIIYFRSNDILVIMIGKDKSLRYYSSSTEETTNIELNWNNLKQKIRSEILNEILNE